jgi:hypothetical protein
MTRCIRCSRPLKNPAHDGMGPTCYAKAGKPIPAGERDLFGFDIAAAAEAAVARVLAHIESLALTARMETGLAFIRARRRLRTAE